MMGWLNLLGDEEGGDGDGGEGTEKEETHTRGYKWEEVKV